MIYRKVLIRPYKSPGSHEVYSVHKHYGIKHKKPQTGNLTVAVSREKKLWVEREKEIKKQTNEKSQRKKEESETEKERDQKEEK